MALSSKPSACCWGARWVISANSSFEVSEAGRAVCVTSETGKEVDLSKFAQTRLTFPASNPARAETTARKAKASPYPRKRLRVSGWVFRDKSLFKAFTRSVSRGIGIRSKYPLGQNREGATRQQWYGGPAVRYPRANAAFSGI